MMKCSPPTMAPGQPLAGFSLLELLISIAILSVTLIPALQSSIGSQRLSDQSEETRLALSTLEEARLLLHASTPNELADAGGEFTVGQALNVASDLDAAVVTYDLPNWAAGQPIPAVMPIRLTMTWNSAMDQPRTMTLVDAIR